MFEGTLPETNMHKAPPKKIAGVDGNVEFFGCKKVGAILFRGGGGGRGGFCSGETVFQGEKSCLLSENKTISSFASKERCFQK